MKIFLCFMQRNLTKNDISSSAKVNIPQQLLLQKTFAGNLSKMKVAITTLQVAMKKSTLKSLQGK